MWKRPHLRLARRLTSTRYIMENLEKERKENLSDLTLSAVENTWNEHLRD